MKNFKYIIGLVIAIAIATSCKKDFDNPELKDSDLTIFYLNSGKKAIWEDYQLLLGDSIRIDLMISPSEKTSVKWVNSSDSTIINETLSLVFKPEATGEYRREFTATRDESGFSKKATFNFEVLADSIAKGAKSKLGVWQNFGFPQGKISGTFTVEFDMVAEKNNTNCITGFQSGEATGYGDLSAIIRFNTAGKFDARNGGKYSSDKAVTYSAGQKYHFRLEINTIDMTYDVFITDSNGKETKIANDYAFRKQISSLSHWSLIADDYETPAENQGYHIISNLEITNVKKDSSPRFKEIDDVTISAGEEKTINILAIDPLGKSTSLTATSIPRYAIFTDKGNGRATLLLRPYKGSTDLGKSSVKITASNGEDKSELVFDVDVIDGIIIKADAKDATIWGGGHIADNDQHLFIGGIADVINSGNDIDKVVAVIPFALPSIPEGKEVDKAYFEVTVAGQGSWVEVNYDIYALSARSSAEVLTTDFFMGFYGSDVSSNATAIQNGFMTKADVVTPADDKDAANNTNNKKFSISGEAAVSMADFLNGQYNNSATEGQFIFIRLIAGRNDMPKWAHMQIESADKGDDTAPVLKITFKNK